MKSFPLQLDREPSPRRSHKLPALVRDHELDTAKRSSISGAEELEETEENSLPAISPTLALKMSFTIFSIDLFWPAKYLSSNQDYCPPSVPETRGDKEFSRQPSWTGPISGSSPGSGIYANVSTITRMSPSSTLNTKSDGEMLSDKEEDEEADHVVESLSLNMSTSLNCPSQNLILTEKTPAKAEAEECYFSSSSSSNFLEEEDHHQTDERLLDLTHDLGELETESEAHPRTFNQIKQKIQSRSTKIKPDEYVGFSKLPYQVYR